MDLEFQNEVMKAYNAIVTDREWLERFDFDGDGDLNAFESGLLKAVIAREVTLADGPPTEWLANRGTNTLEGRYRILGHLSSGGQADTELAYDLERRGPVVVKRIRLDQVDEWKAVELFKRESTVLQSLNHARIPKFLEAFPVGDPPHTFCIVQEYIAGEPVSRRLEEGGVYTVKEVTSILHQLFSILEYIHSYDPPVVHRDIKPANLILGADERLYLIDFGAASQKVQSAEGGSTVVGTHGYMPLEQYMGVVTQATDLYAVGATALHMISGEPPGRMPFENGRIDFEKYVEESTELRPVLEALLEPIAEERPSVAVARQILTDGERTDAMSKMAASHALVEQKVPWMLTSKEGTKTMHYIDGAAPFHIVEAQNEFLVRQRGASSAFFKLSDGAIAFFFTLFSIWAGVGVALLLVAYRIYARSKLSVRVDSEGVRWRHQSVELDRVLHFRAKRGDVVLCLRDREVDLEIPTKTHEQAQLISSLLEARLQSLKSQS